MVTWSLLSTWDCGKHLLGGNLSGWKINKKNQDKIGDRIHKKDMYGNVVLGAFQVAQPDPAGPAGDTNNPPERRKKSDACGGLLRWGFRWEISEWVEGGDLSEDKYMICFMSWIYCNILYIEVNIMLAQNIKKSACHTSCNLPYKHTYPCMGLRDVPEWNPHASQTGYAGSMRDLRHQ